MMAEHYENEMDWASKWTNFEHMQKVFTEKAAQDRRDAERYRKLKAAHETGAPSWDLVERALIRDFDAAVDALPNPAPAEQKGRK